MRTGVIIVTNPGHVPAEGYIEQALANNPTCAGFVGYDEVTKKLVIERQDRPNLKNLMDVFTACKDSRINVWLGKAPTGYLADDIQPFVLVEDTDEKKTPLVACMLDGDWVTTAPAGSNHSDEFFTALQQLRPTFSQLHRLTKGDVKAMMEEIKGEATTNNLLNTFINRGAIHLMFNDGQVVTVTKNELEKEFDWGYTSNHYMYSEDKKPEEKKNMFSSVLGGSALPKTEPTLVVEPKKEDTPKVADPPKDERKKGPNGKFFVGEMVSCPREIKAPNKIEGWYRHHAGFVPPDYLQYPKVEVREKTAPVASKEEVKTLLGKFPGKETATRILPDTESTPKQIEERTPPPVKHVPNIMPPVEPVKQPDKAPEAKSHLMSTESQKGIVDKFLKETEKMVTTTDRSGNKITDPRDAPALEAKATSFAERIGVKFEDTFGWTAERCEKLMYDYPDAFLHLYLDTRRPLAQMMKTASVVQEPGKVVLPKIGQRKTG